MEDALQMLEEKKKIQRKEDSQIVYDALLLFVIMCKHGP